MLFTCLTFKVQVFTSVRSDKQRSTIAGERKNHGGFRQSYDFGSGMKRLAFELSLIRVCRQK